MCFNDEPVYKTFRRYRLIYVGLAFSEENVNILLGECHQVPYYSVYCNVNL